MDDTTICNMALGEAGTRSSIVNRQEKSKEANACNIYYDPARDGVRRGVRGNLERKQLNFSLLRDAPAPPPQTVPVPWLYEYSYPADCIQARYMMPLFDALPGTAGS